MVIYLLFGIVIVLLGIVIFLLLKSEKIKREDIESVILKVWEESGVNERLGELSLHAKEIKEVHRSLERILRVPLERASLGEIALETILSDQLPPDMFGIRKKVLDGKIPDAYIKSTVGIICIDSKFPLENYRKMLESEDPKEKEVYRISFLRDVKLHLEKVANDYVCPEKGSAEFAFAYIPSESVYWFLVNFAFDMLRDYVKRGVQVVSPLTLAHKIELIKAGVHAKKLSEEAERVSKILLELSRRFEKIDKIWNTFYSTHLKNLTGKAEELDLAYKSLREEFNKISKLIDFDH